MDALELLKADHDKVKNLCERVQSSETPEEKRRLFRDIRQELELHTHIEETVFYPAFAKYDEFKDTVRHAIEEHQKIKDLIREISGERDNRQLEMKLDQLIENFERHVQEEENEFFPNIRKMLKRPEREVLGRHLQAAKSERPMAA
jgi:iron-sulfur cluster repair protein YtfE (RIC family)